MEASSACIEEASIRGIPPSGLRRRFSWPSPVFDLPLFSMLAAARSAPTTNNSCCRRFRIWSKAPSRVDAATTPRSALSSSTVPYASMRKSSFGTRLPPMSEVSPRSPVLVYILIREFYRENGKRPDRKAPGPTAPLHFYLTLPFVRYRGSSWKKCTEVLMPPKKLSRLMCSSGA